jgi:hypothetical protein
LSLHWSVQQPPSIATHSEVWSYVRAAEQPRDTRPRDNIDVGRGWVHGKVRMGEARSVGGHARRARTSDYSKVEQCRNSDSFAHGHRLTAERRGSEPSSLPCQAEEMIVIKINAITVPADFGDEVL